MKWEWEGSKLGLMYMRELLYIFFTKFAAVASSERFLPIGFPSHVATNPLMQYTMPVQPAVNMRGAPPATTATPSATMPQVVHMQPQFMRRLDSRGGVAGAAASVNGVSNAGANASHAAAAPTAARGAAAPPVNANQFQASVYAPMVHGMMTYPQVGMVCMDFCCSVSPEYDTFFCAMTTPTACLKRCLALVYESKCFHIFVHRL